MPVQTPPGDSRPAQQVDSIIHERTRLAMMGALAARDRISFTELKGILDSTDGNVSAHARKLEEAGYIIAHKRFEGRVPRTEYELTVSGRAALNDYLNQMERLINSMRGS
jgi:DNA-binding transcriptional ArsR family regulator